LTEDPTVAIDEYLTLVRSYLPDEIADDVIREIRAYLIEGAQELGHGQFSIESVRKSISRFGAPSEVAQEYSRSILEADEDEPDDEPGYEESASESIRALIESFPRHILTTFGLFLAWFVLFALVLVIIPYSFAPSHIIYFETVLDGIMLASLFSVLILVYFLYRLLLVKIIGSTSVFGERPETEIVIDFIASFIAIFGVISVAAIPMYQAYLHNFGIDGAHLVGRLLGLNSFFMTLVILVRMFADLLALARPMDSVRATRILVSSGFILSLGIAVLIGAAIPIVGPHLLLWSDYTLLALIAFFLAFQASTLLIKLVEIYRKADTPRQPRPIAAKKGGSHK
jgi:hypothetical protein